MLNRNNKTIWYALGRLYGLCDWATDMTGQHELKGNALPNKFIEYPHKHLAVIAKAINESIRKMRYNEQVNKAQKCEGELMEIMNIIDPEEMPSGNSPVSVDAQGMIQLGIYHEKSYLYEE